MTNAPTCPAHDTPLLWRVPDPHYPKGGGAYFCADCQTEITNDTLTINEAGERRVAALNRYVPDADAVWDAAVAPEEG